MCSFWPHIYWYFHDSSVKAATANISVRTVQGTQREPTRYLPSEWTLSAWHGDLVIKMQPAAASGSTCCCSLWRSGAFSEILQTGKRWSSSSLQPWASPPQTFATCLEGHPHLTSSSQVPLCLLSRSRPEFWPPVGSARKSDPMLTVTFLPD